MIIFVDNEHEVGYTRPWGEKVYAMRTRIKYRLEDITGDDCLLIRYQRVTPKLVENYNVRAIFVSGNSAEPELYDPKDTAGLEAVLCKMDLPIFCFCGGFQVLGTTLGVPLERMGWVEPPEFDENGNRVPIREFGYMPVKVEKSHPVLEGLGEAPIVRHAHRLELTQIPNGFDLLASTEVCPIQMIAHQSLPVVGSQFHPEYFTDEHPAGRIMIENFCRMSDLI